MSPAELGDLGLSVEPLSEGAVTVSRSEALRIAHEEYDPPGAAETLEAFLYRVTDPSTLRSDDPIDKRPVWIVRFTNVSVHSPGGRLLTRQYSFVDATDGTWLIGHWR
jgi:hypothetical protein